MTTEGYAETEEELQQVIRSEGFRWYAARFHEANLRGDALRKVELLEEVHRRYGPELAAGIVEWESEE